MTDLQTPLHPFSGQEVSLSRNVQWLGATKLLHILLDLLHRLCCIHRSEGLLDMQLTQSFQ